jgi:hypothetical protein
MLFHLGHRPDYGAISPWNEGREKQRGAIKRMMVLVLTILLFLLLYLALCGALIGAGLAISYLLRWGWPGIDFGTGLLIGVVTATIAFHYFLKIFNALPETPAETKSEDEDEDEDELPIIRALPPLPRRKKRGQRRQW